MVEESVEDAGSSPESNRARRAPPTIDLEAEKVTTAVPPEQPGHADSGAEKAEKIETADEQPKPSSEQQPAAANSPPASPSISPWVIAPFSGAVAAALVIGIGSMLGWPQIAAPSSAPQVSAASFNDLRSRVASLEAKANKPAAPVADQAVTARIGALDKSIATLRNEMADQRARSDKLAATVNSLKSAPPGASGTVDLSGVNDQLAKLEQAMRTQSAAIARQDEKIAGAKPAVDLPLRRVIAATLLDVAVRYGDPYQRALATAKSLASNPGVLKPLDRFAATGMPTSSRLNRELLALVPKLSPPPQVSTPGPGILNRLKASASKLVRIERTDTSGNGRDAVVARIAAAAAHNDLADARRELNGLPPSARAPAQAWLDKVNARDAALAASRQFADETMAALVKPGH
ncbi:MAG: COG4223 family protein [Bradyrhizobium sp.]